jgi:hypothetical protein
MKDLIVLILVAVIFVIVVMRYNSSSYSQDLVTEVENMLRQKKTYSEVMDYLASNKVPVKEAVDAFNEASRRIPNV